MHRSPSPHDVDLRVRPYNIHRPLSVPSCLLVSFGFLRVDIDFFPLGTRHLQHSMRKSDVTEQTRTSNFPRPLDMDYTVIDILFEPETLVL